jgi:thioredoxin reductase
VHGLLGHDGIGPSELMRRGRAEVRRYGGQIMAGDVAAATRDEDQFVVTLGDGRGVRSRRLLIATGLVDDLPDLPGLRELWGRDVLHCPYCHGWEVRDKTIGVLATGPRAMHQASLFRQLSDDVVFLSHTAPPTDEQAEELAALGIRVIDGEVASLDVEHDHLAAVRLTDGTVIRRDVLVVMPWMVARTDCVTGLGLRRSLHPSGLGEHLPTDSTGRTDVPGVWAAGNVTDLAAQVGGSAAAGAFAATQINADLVAEDTRIAIDNRRQAVGRVNVVDTYVSSRLT